MIGLGSNSQLGIGIAIMLQDQFSGTASKVEQRILSLKKAGNSLMDGAARDYRNMSAGIAATAAMATSGFYGMIRGASEFGHKMNQVDILGGGRLGRTKAQLGTFAQKMAGQFAMMPKDISEGMLENARAGITRGMEQVTKYQAAVATSAGESMPTIAENLLGITHAMGMSIDEFPRVANAVTAAANASMSSVQSIGESMQYAAFAAHQFNIPLEQTLALVSKLSQSNIRGTAAGTALNNMFQYLGVSTSVLATKKQKKAWDMLGLDIKQMGSMMNHGNVFGVIEAVDKSMQKIAPNDRLAILKTLTNMRGSRGMLGSWGSTNSNQSLGGFLGTIKGGVSSDIAMSQSKAMMNDPYSSMMKVQVAWENFKINFISSMAPIIMAMMTKIEHFVNILGAIAQTPIGTVFGTIMMVAVPLVGVLFAFRAAALTATFALRGLAGMGGGMGFKNIMGGLLDNASRPGWNATGLGSIGRNRAGKYYVKAGQSFNLNGKIYNAGQILPHGFKPINGGWMAPATSGLVRNAFGNWYVKAGSQFSHEGQIYKAGQMLPRNFNPVQANSSNAWNTMALGTTTSGSLLSKLGTAGSWGAKALPILGDIGMVAGRLLPIVGWGLTLWNIYDVLVGMRGDNNKKEKEEKQADPAYSQFKRSMDEQLYRYNNPAAASLMSSSSFISGLNSNNAKLQQTIQVNVDTQQAFSKNLEQEINKNMSQYLPFNLQQ